MNDLHSPLLVFSLFHMQTDIMEPFNATAHVDRTTNCSYYKSHDGKVLHVVFGHKGTEAGSINNCSLSLLHQIINGQKQTTSVNVVETVKRHVQTSVAEYFYMPESDDSPFPQPTSQVVYCFDSNRRYE